MNKFNKDLKFGNEFENKFCSIFKLTDYEIKKGKFLPYDVIDNTTQIKYEVKADRYTYKTGNICIEFECNNKPSGINTSESDYYIYFVVCPNDEYDLYKIPTKSIKRRIKTNLYKKVMYGGDNNASKFYLFDKMHFEKFKI
jgi:hypothetical protein